MRIYVRKNAFLTKVHPGVFLEKRVDIPYANYPFLTYKNYIRTFVEFGIVIIQDRQQQEITFYKNKIDYKIIKEC